MIHIFSEDGKKGFSAIDVMNPRHILTKSKLEGDHESLLTWENDNKQVCLTILSI